MRKGFAELVVVIVGAFILASGFFFWQKQTPAPPAPKVGTATQTGNFPVSLNNFQDNDVINAGDWNAIESAIGITGSASTTSLNYKLTNSSSIDPGHKHTTAGISGQVGVAQGGSATSTFIEGLVVASGTSAFSSLVSGGNGYIPIGSGAHWTAATITAGSGISVTNGAGSITITNTSNPDLITASTTNVTVSATSAETAVVSSTIPANTLGSTDIVRATAWFSSFDTNAGTDFFTLVWQYGGTRLATTTLNCAGHSPGVGCFGKLDLELYGAGATSSQEAIATSIFTSATTTVRFLGVTPAAPYGSSTAATAFSFGNSAVDSTTAQSLKLLLTNSTNSANQSATMTRFLIWRVKQ